MIRSQGLNSTGDGFFSTELRPGSPPPCLGLGGQGQVESGRLAARPVGLLRPSERLKGAEGRKRGGGILVLEGKLLEDIKLLLSLCFLGRAALSLSLSRVRGLASVCLCARVARVSARRRLEEKVVVCSWDLFCVLLIREGRGKIKVCMCACARQWFCVHFVLQEIGQQQFTE